MTRNEMTDYLRGAGFRVPDNISLDTLAGCVAARREAVETGYVSEDAFIKKVMIIPVPDVALPIRKTEPLIPASPNVTELLASILNFTFAS